MQALIALLLTCLAQEPVEGLRAGEVATPVAAPSFARGLGWDLVYGRVLDASNARPVAGARVEAWSENWPTPAALIDATTTGRDGAFVLLARDGGVNGEKLCVRAAGYRWTGGALRGEENLFLVPAPAPLAAGVVDLPGRPIEGATFSTRHTCAHEPPANRVHSDARGRLDLTSFPPFQDNPEGELEAAGFEALRNLEIEQYAAGVPVHLGRKRPLRVRVLDEHGQWSKRTRVLLGGAPEWRGAFTDDDGLVVFDTLFRDPPFLIQVVLGGNERFLAELCPWRDAELTLRLDGERYARSEAAGDDDALIVIRDEQPDAPWLLVHDDGWWIASAGEHALPPGRCTLYVGADFSGWRERRSEIVLAAGSRVELAVNADREPRVTLDPPPAWVDSIVLEAVGHSQRWYGIDELTRPAGEPTLLVAAGRGRCVRAALDASEQDVTIDLTALADCHSAAAPDHARRTLTVEAPDDVRASLQAWGYQRGDVLESELAADSTLEIEAGTPCELWLSADAHLPRCVVLPPGGDARVAAGLVASATLRLEGALQRVIGPHGEVDPEDGAANFELAGLAPGPLTVRARRGDGTWLALELELAPGERRTLTLR